MLLNHHLPHEPKTLFSFTKHGDGFFHSAEKNGINIATCNQMIENYMKITNSTVDPSSNSAKNWTTADINALISARCNDNPSSFRHIAFCLNQHYNRIGIRIDRPFTGRICVNKQVGKTFPWNFGCK